MSIRTTPRILGKVLALAVVFISAGLFTGCGAFWSPVTDTGGSGGGSTNGSYVYAVKNGTNSVAGYAVSSGGLTAISGSPVTIPAAPTSLAITPANSFLYIGTSGGVYGYSIGTGGVLSSLNSNAVLISGVVPASMDISPDGNWLLVLSGSIANGIYVYPLNTSTGIPGAAAQQNLSVPLSGIPQAIKFAPNQAIVAATFGSGGDDTYTFNSSTGALTFVSPINFTSNDAANSSDSTVVFNATSNELFIARGGGGNAIATYPINATSAFIPSNQAILYATSGTNPLAAILSQSGSYAYAVNTGPLVTPGNTISGYTVGGSPSSTTNTVTLTTLATSPYGSLATGPAAIVADKSGGYIIVLNQSGNSDLVEYSINTGVTSPGQLQLNGSVSTGLSISSSNVGAGVALVATH